MSKLAEPLAKHQKPVGLCGIHSYPMLRARPFSVWLSACAVADAGGEIKRRTPIFGKPLLIFEQQGMGTNPRCSRKHSAYFHGCGSRPSGAGRRAAFRICALGSSAAVDGFPASLPIRIGHVATSFGARGRGILSEFPELCGVEQNLITRSKRKRS